MTPNDPISENDYRGAMAAHFPASLESEELEDPTPSQTRVRGKNIPRGRTTCGCASGVGEQMRGLGRIRTRAAAARLLQLRSQDRDD